MDQLEPALYSDAEVEFLHQHVGENPLVLFKYPLPIGVNQAAVKPVVQRIYDLQQLEALEGQKWLGLEKVKEGLAVFLRERAFSKEQAKRLSKKNKGIALYSSMYAFDAKGKAHHGASGTDSNYVRSYYDKDGKRIPFMIEFIPPDTPEWTPPWVTAERVAPKELIEDLDKHRFECAICAHTESFKPDSRPSLNAARARMASHMKKADFEAELHREYYTNVFKS